MSTTCPRRPGSGERAPGRPRQPAVAWGTPEVGRRAGVREEPRAGHRPRLSHSAGCRGAKWTAGPRPCAAPFCRTPNTCSGA
eukprot:5556752-Alexandrium_andersonii.AAC.1